MCVSQSCPSVCPRSYDAGPQLSWTVRQAPMTHRIALLRGINVGHAKRIAMADLRGLIEDLGFTNVKTLLNSGNVVFHATRRSDSQIVSALEAAISKQFGFAVPVVVLTGNALDSIVAENPLPHADSDPAKLLVAFVNSTSALSSAKVLLKEQWAPEAVAVGTKAAYLWCANGIIQSSVAKAFSRAMGDAVTMRNWATVLKLQRAVGTAPTAD